MATEVVGMTEAAEIVGVSKSNFSAHRNKYDGEDQCPEPTTTLSCGPVWAGPDVARLRKWAKEFAKIKPQRAAPGQGKKALAKAAAATKSAAKPAAAPAKKTPAKAAVAKKAAAPKAPATKKGMFGKS